MKIRPKLYHFLAVWLVVLTAGYSIAMPYRQDNKQRPKSAATKTNTAKTAAQWAIGLKIDITRTAGENLFLNEPVVLAMK